MPSEAFRKVPVRGQGPAKRKAQGPGRNEEKGPRKRRDQCPEASAEEENKDIGHVERATPDRWRRNSDLRPNIPNHEIGNFVNRNEHA